MTQPPMIFAEAPPSADDRRRRLRAAYREDETAAVERILAAAELPAAMLDRIAERARDLVHKVRQSRLGQGGLDAFLHEYELSSREGVVLMCLAEALVRIPDGETANLLIKDKLADADWRRHLGSSESLFVNASTWALMLTGRVIRMDQQGEDLAGVMRRLVARSGEPVIRQAVTQAMRILGRQFVMGRTIEALGRARAQEKRGYRCSYTCWGSARTARDAERYDRAYRAAAIAARLGGPRPDRGATHLGQALCAASALRIRPAPSRDGRAGPRLAALAPHAKAADISFTVVPSWAELGLRLRGPSM
jgi:RHH-type proline utilization regulon transcriptional repressor/proline dehydrogenase/delta 1-pyrroline-5-carboxylate dehydrogenase